VKKKPSDMPLSLGEEKNFFSSFQQRKAKFSAKNKTKILAVSKFRFQFEIKIQFSFEKKNLSLLNKIKFRKGNCRGELNVIDIVCSSLLLNYVRKTKKNLNSTARHDYKNKKKIIKRHSNLTQLSYMCRIQLLHNTSSIFKRLARENTSSYRNEY
jgi:hypothetical protein